MPISRYIADTQISIAPGPRGDVESAGIGFAAVRRAVDQLGHEAAIGVAQERREAKVAEQQAAAVETGKAMSGAREHWANRMLELENGAPEGAAGFTGQLLTEFDEDAKARIAAASEPARPALEQRLASFRGQLSDRAVGFEWTQRMTKRASDLTGMVDQHVNAVRTDDGAFAGAIGDATAAIENAGLRGDVKDRMLREARSRLAAAALQGINERDPERGQKLLTGGNFDDYLHGPAKHQLVNDNQVELRRLEANRERAAKEIEARHQTTVLRLLDDELASRANEGKSSGLSDEQIRNAFKSDPERAQMMIERINAADRQYVATQKVALTSPAEDEQILAGLKPAAGEGYASGVQTQNAVAGAIERKRRALNDDPAAYAFSASPALRHLAEVASKDKAQIPALMIELDETQGRLGVPPERRRLLGRHGAAAEVGRLMDLPPEQLANSMEALRGQYGDRHFPRVMRELVEAKLPPSLELLSIMDRPGDAVTRKVFAEAHKVGPKTLRDNLDRTVAGDTEKAVKAQLEDFGRTARYSGSNDRLLNTVQGGVETLAFYHAGRGMNASQAARLAADQVINGRYDFAQTYRVPKGQLTQVETHADLVMRNLKPEDLPAPGGGDPALPETARREAALSFARRGQWVTNESDDGLVLLYPDLRPVVDTRGKRIEFKFGDPLPPVPAGDRKGTSGALRRVMGGG